jgi:outer membrane receptor protein involved in Fe transport
MVGSFKAAVVGLAAVALTGLLLSVPLSAQVAGGTLSGTVTDQSGAVIPNGQVSIKNVATGVTRDVTGDASGFYTAPNLLPGDYEVTVSAPGFATEVRTGITLTVGAQQVLNLTMQVGRVTEKVQVAGEAPAVQLATSSMSEVVNSTTVRELPLNGRSWTDLANLQPGVAPIETQPSFALGSDRGNRGFGAQVTISGARPQQNNYRLDGISVNDYSNGAPGSVLGGNLGVDAIQEFSVLTSNYSAEYGKTSGGVVNAITRSGTNQFHGSAYEFLRNNALDARNFFDSGSIPPFRRNQFGVGAGGPIRKDRTFVFADYEGIRQSKGITNVDTVLSPAARAGNLSTGTVTVDPSVQKYFGLFPLPNGGLLNSGDTGIFTFAGQQAVNENFLTTRIDHRFSEKDSLFGTYLVDKTPYTSPDSFGNVGLTSLTKRQLLVLEENHIFSPSLVNSLRFGINRELVNNDQGVKALNPLAKDLSLSASPGRNAASVSVPGLTAFPGGVGALGSFYYRWTSIEGYDDAFLTKGLHSFKLGVALERMRLNQADDQNNGNFYFGTLAGFLTNHPQRFDASFSGSNRAVRETLFGLYIQDDWRARPNLTLNLGLRYEMTTAPTEIHGQITRLINITDDKPQLGGPFFLNPTLRNFEPRVGFAWDPSRNGKTAVRGSFGFFDVLPLPYEFMTMVNMAAPFRLQGRANHLPAGSFFTGAFPLLGVRTLQQNYIQHDPHRNYVMQWNLNVQQELAPNLTALIGYVGSRGVHQPFRADDVNIVIPTATSAGYLWPSPIGNGATINANNGDVRGVMWGGNSVYDALEVGIAKRMSHGFQVQGSYTWGKSIDTSSATLVGDAFGNSISSLQWFDLRLSRALADFNITRTLVINGTWQVPTLKSASGPLAWAVNGWELGGIFKANDGVPFTAAFGTDGDPAGLNSQDPWSFPDRLVGSGCGTLTNPGNPNNYIKTQCFAVPTAPTTAFYAANCDPTFGTAPQCFNLRGNAGRNILIGPGVSNLDFSIFKNNYVKRISESFNVQFRAEFFNILNHANFAVPVTPDNVTIFDSTGAPTGAAGLLTSTSTTAREIQFALKLVW